jgi:GNAT superfamily N-acetyltransferase
MNALKIVSISEGKTMRDFIEFPKKLYTGNKQYVPDLDSDVRDVFNSKKNHGLDFSEVEGFVAYKDGKAVGRVMAILNRRANEKWNTKVVRFGYLDFIDDAEVSKALLDKVSEWGRERGMDTVQGPLGITDYDKEGMLMSDFDLLNSMVTYYNYPYYPEHMANLGYTKAADWVSVRIDIPEELPARYVRVAKLSAEMFELKLRTLTKKEIRDGYIYKIFKLLNSAFSPLFGFSDFTDAQAEEYMNKYLPIADTRMMPVVENQQGEPVAVAVTIGSLSHALRRSHGRLFPFGWLPLLSSLKWKREDTVDLLLIAVRPDLQGLGLTAMLFVHLLSVYKEYGFKWAETGPQLEDNFKELRQWDLLHPEFVKHRRCWQKSIKNE